MAHYATLETSKDFIKRRNFFNVTILFSAVGVVFQFVSIYFFGILLKSPALVGIFLALGSAVATVADVPVGVLQKYFSSRSLIITSAGMMLTVGLIFMYLIMGSNIAVMAKNAASDSEVVSIIFSFLFGNVGNILLVILCAVLSGLISELNDVTTLSYLMNNADPSEYGELLSKKNVYGGVGAVFGLALASVILLVKSPAVVIMPFLIVVGALVIFVAKYFDNTTSTLKIQDVYKLKMVATRGAANVQEFMEDPKAKMKEYATASVGLVDFQKIAKGLKVVVLKPMELKNKIDFPEMMAITKKEFRGLWDVLLNPKFRNFKILWITGLILSFGFWDTFAVTYLSDFIGTFKDPLAKFPYIILGVLAVPAFGLQIPFIKLSQKIGYYKVVVAGVLLSAVAAFLLPMPNAILIFLVFGLINTTGYAAAMPLAQSVFSEYYNELYAKVYGLSEIDSNTSAAPLKVVLNAANIVGSALGGVFVFVGFSFAFIAYAFVLFALLYLAIAYREKWAL